MDDFIGRRGLLEPAQLKSLTRRSDARGLLQLASHVGAIAATGVGPVGIVRQTYARCIGCRYCTAACPYTRRVFNWSKPEFQGDFSESLSPDVSVRPKGVVEKCTFCHHRLIKAREQARAEERNLNEGEYLPACVEVCPANAMYFGDLNDPASTVSELARSPRAYHLLEELGTEPKVTYLSRGE